MIRIMIACIFTAMLPMESIAEQAIDAPFTVKKLEITSAERLNSRQLRRCEVFFTNHWTKLSMQVAVTVRWRLKGDQDPPIYDLAWKLTSTKGEFEANGIQMAGIEPLKQSQKSSVQLSYDSTYRVGIGSGSTCPELGTELANKMQMVEPPEGVYLLRLSMHQGENTVWHDEIEFLFSKE